jgi:hypothetical protein
LFDFGILSKYLKSSCGKDCPNPNSQRYCEASRKNYMEEKIITGMLAKLFLTCSSYRPWIIVTVWELCIEM